MNSNIYTEQSHEVGETPIKGDFVGIALNEGETIIYGQIIADTISFIILLDNTNNEIVFNKKEFEYRPYLTDRQKAINDVAYRLKANGREDNVLAVCIINSLVNIKALTFTENKND